MVITVQPYVVVCDIDIFLNGAVQFFLCAVLVIIGVLIFQSIEISFF